MKRLAVPVETQGFDNEADMVGNLSFIDDDFFNGPVAGKFLAIAIMYVSKECFFSGQRKFSM